MCPHGQGGRGLSQCGHFVDKGRERLILCGRLLWTAPYAKGTFYAYNFFYLLLYIFLWRNGMAERLQRLIKQEQTQKVLFKHQTKELQKTNADGKWFTFCFDSVHALFDSVHALSYNDRILNFLFSTCPSDTPNDVEISALFISDSVVMQTFLQQNVWVSIPFL